ncbi:MAG: hypothetical protein HDR82_09555 [Bacteroides sp.]|nr:hypothetical protein [Bacteroides sp.]
MTQRERLQRQLDQLKTRHRDMMRGRLVPSSRAQSLQRQILDTQEQIKQLDLDAAERLALERAPIDEILEIIAIPLLADVINDVVAGVDATLRRRGAQETIFSLHTTQIRKSAMAIVDTLAVRDQNLPRLLDVDDTLIDAIKKKIMAFIRQRLNITR